MSEQTLRAKPSSTSSSATLGRRQARRVSSRTTTIVSGADAKLHAASSAPSRWNVGPPDEVAAGEQPEDAAPREHPGQQRVFVAARRAARLRRVRPPRTSRRPRGAGPTVAAAERTSRAWWRFAATRATCPGAGARRIGRSSRARRGRHRGGSAAQSVASAAQHATSREGGRRAARRASRGTRRPELQRVDRDEAADEEDDPCTARSASGEVARGEPGQQEDPAVTHRPHRRERHRAHLAAVYGNAAAVADRHEGQEQRERQRGAPCQEPEDAVHRQQREDVERRHEEGVDERRGAEGAQHEGGRIWQQLRVDDVVVDEARCGRRARRSASLSVHEKFKPPASPTTRSVITVYELPKPRRSPRRARDRRGVARACSRTSRPSEALSARRPVPIATSSQCTGGCNAPRPIKGGAGTATSRRRCWFSSATAAVAAARSRRGALPRARRAAKASALAVRRSARALPRAAARAPRARTGPASPLPRGPWPPTTLG